EREGVAGPADRDLSLDSRRTELRCALLGLELRYPPVRCRVRVSAAGRGGAGGIEAGLGGAARGRQEEGSQGMKSSVVLALGALLAMAAAPDAFAWGAFHGGYGGGAYHGAWGGGAYHSGAF